MHSECKKNMKKNIWDPVWTCSMAHLMKSNISSLDGSPDEIKYLELRRLIQDPLHILHQEAHVWWPETYMKHTW